LLLWKYGSAGEPTVLPESDPSPPSGQPAVEGAY
jgi:hypothetical protein